MDQTNFDESQQLMQPPPEEVVNKTSAEETPVVATKPKFTPKQLVLIGSLVFLVIILVIAGILSLTTQQSRTPQTTPTPLPVVLPTNQPVSDSEFGQKLQQIESQINQTDPATVDLDPPPLDYEIRL